MQYLRERDLLFVYLYVVWSLIQGAVKLLTASHVNTPTSIVSILTIWVPEGQLWFLPFMITTLALTKPWRNRFTVVVSLAAAVALSAAAWGLNGPVAGTQGLGLSAFYALGATLGANSFISLARRVRPVFGIALVLFSVMSLFGLVVFAKATPPTSEGSIRTLLTVALGLVASCAGVVAVLALSRLIANFGDSMRWLSFIGERTLEIFLAHIVAAAGTRIILGVLGIDSAIVHILAGTLAGVALPILLWWFFQRVGFPWLFEAPRALTGGSTIVKARLPAPDGAPTRANQLG